MMEELVLAVASSDLMGFWGTCPKLSRMAVPQLSCARKEMALVGMPLPLCC